MYETGRRHNDWTPHIKHMVYVKGLWDDDASGSVKALLWGNCCDLVSFSPSTEIGLWEAVLFHLARVQKKDTTEQFFFDVKKPPLTSFLFISNEHPLRHRTENENNSTRHTTRGDKATLSRQDDDSRAQQLDVTIAPAAAVSVDPISIEWLASSSDAVSQSPFW